MKHVFLSLLLLPLLFCQCSQPAMLVYTGFMPQELCYLDEVAPGIMVDLKYCGSDNFVGRPIEGYTEGRRAILRKDAAAALAKAQQELNKKGYGLLIWDAYRPHRALQDFYNWSLTDDDRTRATFYPNITKRGIYENKYIGLQSEHSWGVAVDVTLIHLRNGKELDMGGRHDLLDESSATEYAGLTARQQANRRLLRDTLAAAGMRNYSKEWWHYYIYPLGLCHQYDFPLNDGLQKM